MKRFCFLIYLLLLSGAAVAQGNEAYTRVLDRLTSVPHFAERPVLFIVGLDTTKSMSVEFDHSKKIVQTILSRYAAPGDSVYLFGFADKPTVFGTTEGPRRITPERPDRQISSINEALLSLPRSSAQGTVFGRAKLFALEKMQEFGQDRNVIVLLFTDNYSEVDMGTDERKRLEALEKTAARTAETVPLYSEGISPLWLTLYTNSFPDESTLLGPEGEADLSTPRLAWAARRVGSQTLDFIAPANDKVESTPFEVAVQFLGSAEPRSATLSVDGKLSPETSFEDGRASWTIDSLEPGRHLLFVQATLADGKLRTAEREITVSTGRAAGTTPTPPQATTTPTPAPSEGESSGSFPFLPLLIVAVVAAAIYFASLRSIKIRVIGPDAEEAFLIPKGKTLRLGGTPRVESELVFPAGLPETIASVRCLPFGKAKVFCPEELRTGSVEVETDDGYTVGVSGEPLLTSATVTFIGERGRKQVFTLVKEDGSRRGAEESEQFGAGGGGEESSSDGTDWRS